MRLLRYLLLAALVAAGQPGLAQGLPGGLAAMGGPAPWWVQRGQGVPASFAANFAQGRYYQAGIGAGPDPHNLLTTSRASAGTNSDAAGNWYSFAANVPRITNSGVLPEEARTNSIRNNTMAGASAPSTFPNNWTVTGANGLTVAVVSVGTQNSINKIRVQITGTPTLATTTTALNFEAPTQIAATYGETWARSLFFAIVGGDLTNISSLSMVAHWRDSGGASLSLGTPLDLSGATSTFSRFSLSDTPTNASTAFLQPALNLVNNNNTTPISITVDIGWPQLEENTLIRSTVASATVQAAGSGGSNGAVVLTVVGGTGTAATLNGTISGGALTAIGSVASAGSYTTFPPGPAAVTGGGLSGATVNLTPTNNAAQGFATSPILTSSDAVARLADVITLMPPPVFGSSYTMRATGSFKPPVVTSVNQWLALASNNTNSDRFGLLRNSAGNGSGFVEAGGVSIGPTNYGSIAQDTFGKYAIAYASGDMAATNGTLLRTSNIAGVPAAFSRVDIGSNLGSAFLNGPLDELDLWATTRVPNAPLQSMTSGTQGAP